MEQIENKKDLWARWAAHYVSHGIDADRISKDGMICPAKFRKDRSVLFVLKDTNDYGGGDLSELLRNGPRFQMWHTAARWAAGILNEFPEYGTIDNYEKMTEALHQIAVINLKKLAGKASADMKVVGSYADQDKELLLEQIESLNPSIIVACGTFDPLISLLGIPASKGTQSIQPNHSKPVNAHIIRMRHPNRANNKVTYEKLRSFFESDQGFVMR